MVMESPPETAMAPVLLPPLPRTRLKLLKVPLVLARMVPWLVMALRTLPPTLPLLPLMVMPEPMVSV